MLGTNHPWDEYDDDLENITKIKRIVFEMPPDMHTEIKQRAAARGITLKKYILKAIVERIKKERLSE